MSLPANPQADLAAELRAHQVLCCETLAIVENEARTWRQPAASDRLAPSPQRQELLQRLTASLERLRRHRAQWQQLPAAERAQHPEIATLVRQNQELVMKILVLDRENEQVLLRQGWLPPGRLPAASRQRPHYVADLYRRHAAARV